MAKNPISEKLTNVHKLSLECTLNVDELQEGIILGEFEELGEKDLCKYLKKFNGKYVTIVITDKTEETPEE
jgi:hypothetical protein